jgi:chemotaxis protein CheD
MVKTIYMGQFETVRSPDILTTTLGSCVGLVLYDPQTDVFGMAHIMLPASEKGDGGRAGKYADTAIPGLIAKMGLSLTDASRLRAKVAGGANMFSAISQADARDILRVGERNIEATLEMVRKLGIQVLGSHLGGTHGRELSIDAQTGKIWVRTIGSEPEEL